MDISRSAAFEALDLSWKFPLILMLIELTQNGTLSYLFLSQEVSMSIVFILP